MDDQQFDNLIRSLAAGTSRRRVLGALAGGLLGAVGLRDVLGATCREAGRRCAQHANCCSGICDPATNTCVCPPGQQNCRGACKNPTTDYQSDPLNCGGCDIRCPRTTCSLAVCTAGQCGLASDPAMQDHACEDGFPCTVGDVCRVDGSCLGIPKDCSAQNDQCNDGFCRQSDGACIKQPKENDTPCNADSNSCTVGDSCQDGTCEAGPVTECPPCQVCNGGACVPLASDPRCSTVCCNGFCCAAGQECVGNTCQDACVALGSACTTGSSVCCRSDPAVIVGCQDVAGCGGDGVPQCCHQPGSPCSGNCDCCGSSQCVGSVCCQASGATCLVDAHCCTGECIDRTCLDCRPLGTTCTDEAQCCQNGLTTCEGTCCHLIGESCAAAGECCSNRCLDGSCCGGPGSSCVSDAECCTGGLGDCDQDVCRCLTAGEDCGSDFDCCEEMICNQSGQCQPATCQGLQEQCLFDTDCCGDLAFCRESCSPVNLCCNVAGGSCTDRCDCCAGSVCIRDVLTRTCGACLAPGSPCQANPNPCCEGDECRFDPRPGPRPPGPSASNSCLPEACRVNGDTCTPDSPALQCCDGLVCEGLAVGGFGTPGCCTPLGGACSDLGALPTLGECCPPYVCNGANQCAPCRQEGQSCDGEGTSSNCCVLQGLGCVQGVCSR